MHDHHADDESTGDRLRRRRFLGATMATLATGTLVDTAAADPYGGSRHSIPGHIEAEDYDTDGEGWSYSDTTAGNAGGAYRDGDVDIEVGGDNYNVGWTEAGEWLNYSVTVDTAGTYEVTARVASGAGGGQFTLQQDQADLATVDVPGTGGWQTWTTVTTTVDLAGGDSVLAVYFDSGGINLDWLEFARTDDASGLSEGTHRIVNVNSGKALDVRDGSTDDGANVQQWEYDGTEKQHWQVESVGDGYYRLVASHSGKALDVSGVSTDDGANVHQWTYVDGENQQWAIEPVGDAYRVLARHSGKALDVSGYSTENGGNVHQWAYHGNANQHWHFETVDDGGGGGGGGGDGTDNYPNLDGNEWELAWNDEFDAGGIDTSVWTFATGGGCGENYRLDTDCSWGNQEEQYYTNGDNAWVQNDRLVIEARDELAPNGENPYTSARLKTENTFEKQYGRVEVRARLPETQGLWPAIWMLGQDIDSVGWPQCGEIDVMELTGDDPTTVHGTVHGPGYSGGDGISHHYSGPNFADGFHDFQVAWYPDAIKWFVDGQHYHTVTKDEVQNAGDEWVFDDQFFLLLNVAVGGVMPGYPDWSTDLPQRMEVEYVRVYDWV